MSMKIRHLFRAGKAVLEERLLGRRRPLAVWIDITNRCPAGCAYCDISKSGKKDMPLEGLLRIMDELAAMGCVRLHLPGGDPLIRDDIGEIIGRGKGMGFLVTLSVREHFVRRRLEALKNADMVFLSFEGLKDVHEELKGRGSFPLLLDAFKALRERGIRTLTTTTLTRRNREFIPFILETARNYGFVTNFQCLHYPLGAAGGGGFRREHPLAELLLDEEEHRRIGNELIALKRSGAPIADSEMCLRRIFIDWEDHRAIFLPRRPPGHPPCRAGRLFCQIDVEGIVYPCGSTFERARKELYLNALEVGMRKAFRALPESSCAACVQACHVELNLLLSLNPGTIMHWCRQLIGKRI